MDKIIPHREAYVTALKNKDEASLLLEKAWLTATATAVLLEQETDKISEMRAFIADLAPLADRLDMTGKPGDRWRALGDVLTLALESGKPLEQLNLVLPSTVSGLFVKHISKEPGITQIELGKRCGKNKSHVSNEIKKLEDAGLIYRKKHGRENTLYLTRLGKETLENTEPVKFVLSATPESKLPYVDQNRLEKLGTPTIPYNQAMQ